MSEKTLVLFQRLILFLVVVLVSVALLNKTGGLPKLGDGDGPQWMKQVGTWVTSEVKVPYWAFVILLLTGIPFWMGLLKSARRASLDPGDSGEIGISYVEDAFQGVIWNWRYDPSGDVSEVLDLQCYCPSCRKALVWRETTYTPLGPVALVACDHCGFSKGLEGKRKVVITTVLQNIRNNHESGRWRDRVGRFQARPGDSNEPSEDEVTEENPPEPKKSSDASNPFGDQKS